MNCKDEILVFTNFTSLVLIFTMIVLLVILFTGTQLGGGDEGRSPLSFFENRERCPDFGKKDSNCAHPWVESPIQNVVLRESRRKSFKIFKNFSCSCVFDEKFIEVP